MRAILCTVAMLLAGCRPAEKPSANCFLALGDSYTIGGSVGSDERWPVQLARKLRDKGVDVGLPQIIATTGWTTDELSAGMDEAKPASPYRLVTLLIGVNNQFRGRSVNSRQVYFVTIRRRGPVILKRLEQTAASEWKSATIDIPKRRNKRIAYLDEGIRLDDYEGALVQIAVTGLGREQPTLFMTNHPAAPSREIIMNYARRNGIEDGLGTNVNFFHMDNLSSEVRLNVDLDVTLTVVANSCYRWLASTLKGFGHAKPKQLSRKFIETSGEVELLPSRKLRVTLDRRCHNPILREAALDKGCQPISWLNGARIEFTYR